MTLELQNISKKFEVDTTGDSLLVLDALSLKVTPGEALAIVGPSGSGKSTLLNIIGALDKPTSGSVKLGGRELTTLDENRLTQIRNRKIGFIFQLHHLLPQCSVLENVLIPTIPLKEKKKTDEYESRARELLEIVGLENRLQQFPAQLSGGERQRVAVVRALINNPKLILADEPTGSLDQKSSHNLADLLIELNETRNVTLIVVTHSMEIAQKMKKIYRLADGKLREAS